jgi:hypothetical protein
MIAFVATAQQLGKKNEILALTTGFGNYAG